MKQGNEPDNASEEFTAQIRQTLDDSENNIDELTLSRIRAARVNAVENAVSAVDNKHAPGSAWIPVGSFATVLVAVLAVVLFNQGHISQNGVNQNDVDSTSITQAGLIETADMEMLASVESLEMLDDLEFYQWLEMELDEELSSSAGSHAETLG